MQVQLKGIALQLNSVNAQMAINNALKTSTSTLSKVNEKFDIKDIQNVLKAYAK